MKTFKKYNEHDNITKLNNSYRIPTNMRFLRKARELGGSLSITLDKEITNLLQINSGDLLEIEIIQKVKRDDVPMTEFRCKKCEYKFAQNDENPFCPSCECEELEVVCEELEVVEKSNEN